MKLDWNKELETICGYKVTILKKDLKQDRYYAVGIMHYPKENGECLDVVRAWDINGNVRVTWCNVSEDIDSINHTIRGDILHYRLKNKITKKYINLYKKGINFQVDDCVYYSAKDAEKFGKDSEKFGIEKTYIKTIEIEE